MFAAKVAGHGGKGLTSPRFSCLLRFPPQPRYQLAPKPRVDSRRGKMGDGRGEEPGNGVHGKEVPIAKT